MKKKGVTGGVRKSQNVGSQKKTGVRHRGMPSRLREKLFAKRMLCSGALRTGPEDGNHSSGDVDENRIHKIDTAEFSSKFFKFFAIFLTVSFFTFFILCLFKFYTSSQSMGRNT